jgi:hypothetical protein
MKRKKTFKSLAELSADSIFAVDAEPGKAKPLESHTVGEAPREAPVAGTPRTRNARRYDGWGINE